MIDSQGYRANVGIVLSNGGGKLLWARRIGQDAWQFPQGGITPDETPEEAMYRELREEVGLGVEHVKIIGKTSDWIRYRLPKRFIRHNSKPLCIGQKQIWFLLNLVGNEKQVRFDCCDKPEFDRWCWINYWEPVDQVVSFKRRVYSKVLKEFAPMVRPELITAEKR